MPLLLVNGSSFIHPTVLYMQVRLWDPRDGSKVAKLRGHSDNVRALALSHDGTKALSGSSDGTVKLWDVGLQRCVQVWRVKGEGRRSGDWRGSLHAMYLNLHSVCSLHAADIAVYFT